MHHHHRDTVIAVYGLHAVTRPLRGPSPQHTRRCLPVPSSPVGPQAKTVAELLNAHSRHRCFDAMEVLSRERYLNENCRKDASGWPIVPHALDFQLCMSSWSALRLHWRTKPGLGRLCGQLWKWCFPDGVASPLAWIRNYRRRDAKISVDVNAFVNARLYECELRTNTYDLEMVEANFSAVNIRLDEFVAAMSVWLVRSRRRSMRSVRRRYGTREKRAAVWHFLVREYIDELSVCSVARGAEDEDDAIHVDEHEEDDEFEDMDILARSVMISDSIDELSYAVETLIPSDAKNGALAQNAGNDVLHDGLRKARKTRRQNQKRSAARALTSQLPTPRK